MKKLMRGVLSSAAGAAAVVSVIALVAVSGCPEVVPSVYDVEVTKDVAYGKGYVSSDAGPDEWELKTLLLDVYEPVDAEGPRPAIVLVHGGSFSEGSKEKVQIVEYANFFAGQGYVAFAINYRLTGDQPPAPPGWGVFNLVAAAHAAMVDVNAALRFVHAHANTYAVNPDRIALLGESAGAIAGVSAAVANSDDFLDDGPEFPVPDENNADAGSGVYAYVHLWGSADHVLTQIDAQDPPVMIVHGTDDDEFFTSFGSSERFAAVLELFDVPYVFYEAEGYGHGAWDYTNRRQGIPQLALIFLDEHL